MSKTALNRAKHFSIVWGVTLAIITLVEWNSLERDPVNHEILSPFMQRAIEVSVESEAHPRSTDIPGIEIEPESPDAVLRYQVELGFNGPLFLACFFGPILIFQGLGALWNRSRARS